MKCFSLACLLMALLVSGSAFAAPVDLEGLYINSYGSSQNQSIIFVHGGPGYDSQDFEWSTASALASAGFFVVVLVMKNFAV